MKIEPDRLRGVLIVDVQTRRDGNSAAKIAWDDFTEVTFGGLHAEVLFMDLHIRVIMDPDGEASQWRDIEWARAQAMGVICRPDVAPLVITAMASFHFEMGEAAGRQALQYELRKLLGVSQTVAEPFYGAGL